MAKAKLKTNKTEANVSGFLDSLKDEQQRKDSYIIVEMMRKATKEEPKMWGSAIIGFGDVHLKYESGRELDWFRMGFSPRKQNLTLYVVNASAEQKKLLEKLGKHTTSKGCLYIKKLEDVETSVLNKIIVQSAQSKTRHT